MWLPAPARRPAPPAQVAARALAEQLATLAGGLFDGSCVAHISGCAKGCAHPAAACAHLCRPCRGLALVVDGRAGEPERVLSPMARSAKASSVWLRFAGRHGVRARAPGLPDAARPRQSGRSLPRRAMTAPIICATARRSTSAPSPSSAPRRTCRASRPDEAEVAVRMIHACGAGRGGGAHSSSRRASSRRRAARSRPGRRSCATPRWWRTA